MRTPKASFLSLSDSVVDHSKGWLAREVFYRKLDQLETDLHTKHAATRFLSNMIFIHRKFYSNQWIAIKFVHYEQEWFCTNSLSEKHAYKKVKMKRSDMKEIPT